MLFRKVIILEYMGDLTLNQIAADARLGYQRDNSIEPEKSGVKLTAQKEI